MKTKIYLTFTVLFLISNTFSQSLLLTFTANDSAAYVQLGSIKVRNLTQWCDTTLHWPDTVLVLDYQSGISEISHDDEAFQVFQNYPNPVLDQTIISLFVPEKGQVNLIVIDVLGRLILESDILLEKGTHSFRFTPGEGNIYFFSAQWRRICNSIKILKATTQSNCASLLEYMGKESSSPQLKATEAIQSFSYKLGDKLLYVGNIDSIYSSILATPEASETYTFQFATNIPCLGTPTVTYEGQVYRTIQIFNQCWLKENLNVGTMIPYDQEMSDDGKIEKHCYDNSSNICAAFGGLYQWDEIMQYTTQHGVQGICPTGWHIPTDEEWKVLEGTVDSQYGIYHSEWNNEGWRGFDAGKNLKTTTGWNGGGNGTNLFGFSARPGGGLGYLGDGGYWWTSSDRGSSAARGRNLDFYNDDVSRYSFSTELSFSVRCLRD